MKRKGFTIIELLTVVVIIGILTGIVATAAVGAIKGSRSRRANVLCQLVEAGINTYHAQVGEWPSEPPAAGSANNEGPNGTTDPNVAVLTTSEVKQWIYKVVEMSKKGTPVMDVSGLYVCEHAGESNGRNQGMDFMTAIHGSREHRQRMSISQMHFGYPDPSTGFFRHFKIVYSHATDSIKVSCQ